MAPKLSLDIMAEIAKRMSIWDCLRMGSMSKDMNQAVFPWTVRYVFEHPNRYNSLEPIHYALTTGNVRLLKTLRDLILTDTVVGNEEEGTKMRWDVCMKELINYPTMVQILQIPSGGRQCLELVIDTAIQTGTVQSLNIWNASDPSMLLGNSLQCSHHLSIEIILSRREQLGLGNFLNEMCFRNITVLNGWLFAHHLPRQTIDLLVRLVGFSFYDACRLAFVRAIEYFLATQSDLAEHPGRILEGYNCLLESPSWFSSPLSPGKPIVRSISLLLNSYTKITKSPVPVATVNLLLDQMWRVVHPYVRRHGKFGVRTDITQEQLLQAMTESLSCRVWSQLFNIIINMNPSYVTIPTYNLDITPRLGNIRFIELVRRENIALPLVHEWTQSDLDIIYTP